MYTALFFLYMQFYFSYSRNKMNSNTARPVFILVVYGLCFVNIPLAQIAYGLEK